MIKSIWELAQPRIPIRSSGFSAPLAMRRRTGASFTR
jgi:hypothetical protein